MSDSSTVLLIEDEPDISVVIGSVLRRAGHHVLDAADARAGLRALYEGRPDLVVLDLGLPDLDGFEVLDRIRSATDVPVLMLTARNLEADKVRALDAGADDYMTKPFGNAELASRVHALLRRSGSRSAPTNRYDDGVVQIDFAHRTARVNDQPIALTPTEYRLLRTLVTYPGQVLSIEHLLEDAWRDPSATAPSRVKHTVRRLRGKLAACGADPNVVEAVRGYGYRYRAPL